MNKLIAIITIASFLYFGYMKYFTTHPIDVAEFVIMVFFTMIYAAMLLAVLVIALESSKEDDKNNSEKSC